MYISTADISAMDLTVLLLTGFRKIIILQLGYNFIFSIPYCYIITTIFNSNRSRCKEMVYCDWTDYGWQGIVFLLTGILRAQSIVSVGI